MTVNSKAPESGTSSQAADARSYPHLRLRRMQRFLFSPARYGMGILLALLLTGLVSTPALHAQSSATTTGTVIVSVDGLDSSEGTVRVELTTEANYEAEGNVRNATLPIQQKRARWVVTDVPRGTYAVRLYHDENDNGELDTNLVGVPQEAFGFSNDARGTMGPPDFQEAAFTLDADSLSMSITAK